MRAARRIFDDLHKDAQWHDGTFQNWSKDFSPDTPFHYDDGLQFFMSPVELAPWDKWSTDINASPEKPAGWEEQGVESGHEDPGEAGTSRGVTNPE